MGKCSSFGLSVKTYPGNKVNVAENSLLVSHPAVWQDALFPPDSQIILDDLDRLFKSRFFCAAKTLDLIFCAQKSAKISLKIT